jgi:hypothetical protein
MGLTVSDSSTLIHLAGIDRLDLLKVFFGSIALPPAVWREVVEQGRGRAGARAVEKAYREGWIHIVTPSDRSLLRLLKQNLDAGEAEAIALAVEESADLLLVDEANARATADLYDLTKTGVIGLLIRARREGHIELLKPELDRLLNEAGFWIAENLYRRALLAVGEPIPSGYYGSDCE